jgi:hypothetical protein
MAATSLRGLPLISSVRRLALAWLIAHPRPVKPTRSTIPSFTPIISVIRSPHSGFAPSYEASASSTIPKLWGRR